MLTALVATVALVLLVPVLCGLRSLVSVWLAPYAVAVSVFGGTAEYLALWAKSIGHEPWYYWYVTACIAASLVVYATMPETRSTSTMADD